MNMRGTRINTTEDGIERPLVSVMIPTLNSAKTLETCLRSIKHQRYKNIELVVVDNNSEDNTINIARTYTECVYNSGKKRGFHRNFAASKATGDYYVFIDSDMELPPTMIESALRKCEEEGYDAVVLPEISVGKGFWTDCRKLEKRAYLNDRHMEQANRFMKKGVFDAIDGYDETFFGAEVFDIHQRILKAGFTIARVEEIILHHEIVPFRKMVRKYFLYGQDIPLYIKRNPVAGAQQFVIVRPAYLRNWRMFLKDPTHGAGLAIMKLSQYIAGGLGFITWLLKKKDKGIKFTSAQQD